MDASRVLAAGEGEAIRPGFEIKVGRPEIVLTEARYAPGDSGPDPHVHHDHVDSFFVIEGELEWRVGPELEPRRGGPGTFVQVPRDVLHTFHNPGPGPARFLNIHTPGLGFERYLRGEFPDFDQHYLPQGSGLAPDEVVVLAADEGDRLALADATASIKSGADELLAFVVEVDGEFPHPPEHRHLEMVESFYVLDGEFRLIVEGEESGIPADGFGAVAPGTYHGSAQSAGALRFLNLFAPNRLEGFVREAAAGGEPDLSAYDIEFR
jgi:quercetin dioxygenase-like cupin family protein